MACGKHHVVSHNLLFEGVANTRESLLFKKSNGVMGVPITFMDKYNPEQFEIVWQASGNTRASAPREILCELNYIKHDEDRGGCSVVKGKRTYGRILIRRKGGEVF